MSILLRVYHIDAVYGIIGSREASGMPVQDVLTICAYAQYKGKSTPQVDAYICRGRKTLADEAQAR